ncbi:SOS response-associated peptidase family protein [Sandaracinobacteroides hominis]|uniref:SOS response-associated peptidase family protein n=1 Tax=Sandaracinobacteroides hominis TaxID=2780086 RepID=UPI0018F52A56|nr:SOS response-associated peptidase family protein [Sandaracinobacteroides hominis]
MARIYTVQSSAAEIAERFAADAPPGLSVPRECTEGEPGLVVFERGGVRHLRSMTWGFPRLTREMDLRGEMPDRVGMVSDLTNPMWDKLVVEPRYRCLIPITSFANPDGVEGKKIRTWFSVKDTPLMAWAGFCRTTNEFGPVFAGMTMEANAAVMPYNERMPVLLGREEWERWLHGTIQDVIGFQFRAPIAADRMEITPTKHGWRSGVVPDMRAGELIQASAPLRL